MSDSILRLLFVALLVAAQPAHAADPPPSGSMAAATAAAASKSLKILTEEEVDPTRFLPPPAEDGALAQRTELAFLQALAKTRSPERFAQAKWDGEHAEPMLFAAAIGSGFDLKQLPATAALLALVQNEQAVANDMAKRKFHRTRPYIADPSITVCDWKPGDPTSSSYPSGHATLGFSVGLVLAALIPDKAQPIQTRAGEFGFSRLVCGAHYPGDIEASHVLGTRVATLLLLHPAVQAQIEAARRELHAAHLTD
jgi:acid phosphatase (class A)